MKPRILFVDDEPNVLSGLKLVLSDMREEWSMEFVTSGREALELFEQNPFDVIVSDMAMPVMDGGQLLALVQERHPKTIRLILSGYTDLALIMKTVKPAHQFLGKPCDRGQLKEVIHRTMRLRDVLTNEPIRALLANIESLPTQPNVYAKLEKELRNEVPSLQAIGKLIEADMGLSATLLKLVNSSFFGLRTHVGSPRQAVVLLGTETVKGLVLATELFKKFEIDPSLGFSPAHLWEHSTHIAHLARAIARDSGASQKVIDQSFIAGLLHDVGKLVLVSEASEQYKEVLRLMQDKGLCSHEAERQIFGVSHAEMGAYLLALWGLDEEVVEAVFNHQLFYSSKPDAQLTPTQAVYAADVIKHLLTQNANGENLLKPDKALLEKHGIHSYFDGWVALGKEILMGDDSAETSSTVS